MAQGEPTREVPDYGGCACHSEQCEKARSLYRSLRRDESGRGFCHLGSDGVLRTIDSERKIVDYRQLSPEEVCSVNSELPPTNAGRYGTEIPGG
ncbi:hypothetical protein VTN00DRAFT_9990 [Thermoascus crustaceus]|uniref:uncharacterized protein n=1 Tax=Thermoascus crustaceus TaxID=5088 RepID=UPI0037422806